MRNKRKIKKTEDYYKYGRDCLCKYFRKYGKTGLDWQSHILQQNIVNTEIELNFTIENYHLRGVIDRLDHPETGKWMVHDYNTGKNTKSKKQAENDIQLALYQMAVQQNYENTDEIFLIWHFLRTGEEV